MDSLKQITTATIPENLTSYFLQDTRNTLFKTLLFWAKAGGYTSDLKKAEQFDEASAFNQNKSRHSDVPWPVDYVLSKAHRAVDMQDVSKPAEADFGPSLGLRYYVQDPKRRYSDNDILFTTSASDSVTSVLTSAAVLTKSEADLLIGSPGVGSGTPWLKAYIDRQSRKVVSVKNTDLLSAFEGNSMFSKLAKRSTEPRSPRLRCQGCGIFIKAVDYYCGPCPKCESENRP